jgi:hypothetical protein
MLLASATTLGLLGLAELLLRATDGYRWFTPRLERAAAPVASSDQLPAEFVAAFLARPTARHPEVDPAWFRSSPLPLPRRPVPEDLARRVADGLDLVFCHQWNEDLLRSTWVKGSGTKMGPGIRKPDSYWVFQTPDRQLLPRYRYLPSTTLPDGFTTNAFGFRGRELTTDKPAGVVRIACVGASTTADAHSLPHSYPELLEHFLATWARERDLPVTFEVLNAGTEGYYVTEVAATVRHYVLPLAVDYVLFYEGANQLQGHQLHRHMRFDAPVLPAPPMPAATTGFLAEHSALARRLDSVLLRGESWREPAKPAQRIVLPDGIDEREPDLARADQLLDLGVILSSLGQMRAESAAVGARLVVCSFRWFVDDGLELDPVQGYYVWDNLNIRCWPLTYANIRRFVDLQNRCLQRWAAANDVPFVDIDAAVPRDQLLFTDSVHNTALGARCHAWAAFVALLPALRADLATGRIPVADRERQAVHPNVPPPRLLSKAQLDAGQ